MRLYRYLIGLLLLLTLGWGASGQVELPQQVSGERITLVYPPSLVSRADALAFLGDQEEALAWVETRLQSHYDGHLQITIKSDWFSWYGAATDRFGKRIVYIYESYPLRWLNTSQKTPVHELVHAVTLRGWDPRHPS